MSKTLHRRSIEWCRSGDLQSRLNQWQKRISSASELRTEEPLSKHSWLRIGGPARFWVEVGTIEDLWSFLAAIEDAPLFCVGLGSNTLFPDAGIDGVVMRLVGDLAKWSLKSESQDQAVFEVMGGAINAHLVRSLLKKGWVGAEFLRLIPGTFGGGVVLNAGTKEKELTEILGAAWLAIPEKNKERWTVEERSAEELKMRYRHASLPEGALVLGGRIAVKRGDVDVARKLVKDDKERRNRTQPYRLASVGSTFANPPGDYAGRLIEAVGLKGHAIGGAQVSSLHANFFINDSDATAEDFLSLMALARYRVRRDFNIEMRPEVRFVGFDGRARMRDLEQQWEDRDV